MSESWVRKYISQKYKELAKVKGGQIHATHRVAEKRKSVERCSTEEDKEDITMVEKEESELLLTNVWGRK